MANEARTTAASTRTSVMRLRGLALVGLGLMAAAATVAAGSPTPSASASDSTSTLAVKVSITSPTGGSARQGQTVSYSVKLTPADKASYTNVAITVSAKPDWAAAGLKISCPDTGKAVSGGCTFGTLDAAATITGTVATTSAKAGDELTVTAGGKDDSGSIASNTSAPTTITAKPSHSPTPTPTPSSSAKPPGSTGGSSSGGSGGPGGGTSGGGSGGSGGSGGGSGGGPSGGTSGGGSGGGGGSGTHPGSNSGSNTTSVDGQPHPTLLPTGPLSGMPPSLGVGSSLSATSLPGVSTSPAPTPLVAIPPSTSASGSPSVPIRLTGESSGNVHPVTSSVPLAAVGLVLFVVSGWRLLRRRIRKAATATSASGTTTSGGAGDGDGD